MLSTNLVWGLILNPIFLAESNPSKCVLNEVLFVKIEYKKQSSFRDATTALFCIFIEPEAALRGFANRASPSASLSLFN